MRFIQSIRVPHITQAVNHGHGTSWAWTLSLRGKVPALEAALEDGAIRYHCKRRSSFLGRHRLAPDTRYPRFLCLVAGSASSVPFAARSRGNAHGVGVTS